MSTPPLSKRALASSHAGLAAWRTGQMVMRPPVAALNYVQRLSQTDPADAGLAWLETLAARHGADQAEMVGRPPALVGLTDGERAGLARSDWRVGVSEDALASLSLLPAAAQAGIAQALSRVLQSPTRPTQWSQPVSGERDLWAYEQPPLRLVYAADPVRRELAILLAEGLAPDNTK